MMTARCPRGRAERMTVWLSLLVFLVTACPVFSGTAPSPDGATGPFHLIEVPNPLSPENPVYPLLPSDAPAPGAEVRDSRLGTVQTRVVASPGLRHEYSRHDPFNGDCTKILLLTLAEGEWRVYRTSSLPYDREGNLVRTLSVEEPRWDDTDPDVLWGTRDFSIVRINVETNETSLVKDFTKDPVVGPVLKAEPDLYRITMKDEGESSQGRRYWAFIVQGSQEDYRARYLLVWDRQDDKVLGFRKLSADESNIDWVGMSPKGAWVLIGAEPYNAGDLAGFTMADRAFSSFHPLHYSTGHADVGLDVNGNEVVVMQNAQTDFIDMIPLDPAVKPIPPDAGYARSGHIPSIRLFYSSDSPIGLNSGVHVSCNFPGWCVVSTGTEPGVQAQNWLDRSIVLLKLDPKRPRVFYLTKVYGTQGSYWEETHATMSRGGTRVVWATNWNQSVGQDKVWDMELRLPADWATLLDRPAQR